MQCVFLGFTMKSVPPKENKNEDLLEIEKTDCRKCKVIKSDSDDDMEEVREKIPNNNVKVLKNIPFALIAFGNIPAMMALYLPYMFLPGVSINFATFFETLSICRCPNRMV